MKRNDDLVMAIIVSFVVLAMIFSTGIGVRQWADCNDKGGDYVRGVFWYTCVNEDSP